MAKTYISDKEDISTLLLEQPENAKYQEICKRYTFIRRINGDGNCFYRAVSFACLESLKHAGDTKTFKETVMRSPGALTSAGINDSSFKDIFRTFISVVERREADDRDSTLLDLFNERTTSDSVVKYLRLLTSAHLQNHADFFQNFVEAPNLKVYCTQEVETMAMECDHVEILALSEALGVGVRIVSMEGGDGGLACHTIPDGANPSLHLLYKNSHYDILYPDAPP